MSVHQFESIFSEFCIDQENVEKRVGSVLPILQQIQHKFGYIPKEAFKPLAHFLKIPETHIYGVATFYSHFKLTPIGKNVVTVCRGTACHVRRSASLLDDLRMRLGIEPGETTPDLKFTLETVACIGSCALAPAIVINGKVHGRVTRDKLLKMIDTLDKETSVDSEKECLEVSR